MTIKYFSLQNRLLKPVGGFAGYSSELRELAAVISRVSYDQNTSQCDLKNSYIHYLTFIIYSLVYSICLKCTEFNHFYIVLASPMLVMCSLAGSISTYMYMFQFSLKNVIQTLSYNSYLSQHLILLVVQSYLS